MTTINNTANAQKLETKTSDRYQKGWEKLKEIDGEAGEKVIENLKNISPDLGKYIIEYSFGDIYSREGLDLKSKEIAVVAALTAMSNAEPQLRVHLNGALNTGSSVSEVKEIILQMSSYAGFPVSINAMNVLKGVLLERKAKGLKDMEGKEPTPEKGDRFKNGMKTLKKLAPNQVDILNETYGDFAPELVQFILEYGYGDIYSRDNLSLKHRQIATIAALTALGTARPQLKFHIQAGFAVGLSTEDIKEVILLMTVYSGFPSAINAMNVLKEVMNMVEK